MMTPTHDMIETILNMILRRSILFPNKNPLTLIKGFGVEGID